MTAENGHFEIGLLTSCPKCGGEVSGREECPECGVILMKHLRSQQRKRDEIQAQNGLIKQRNYQKRLVAVLIGIIVFWVAFLLFLIIFHGTIIQAIGHSVAYFRDDDRSLPMYNPGDKSFIQKARRATVTIKTPTGLGSGFFISRNHIVTNHHVVDLSPPDFEQFKKDVKRERQIIELERRKIDELKKQLREMGKGASKKQLKLVIEKKEDDFFRALATLEEKEARLADIVSRVASPVITIILYDGTEYAAGYVEEGRYHDLALINLAQDYAHYLESAPEDYPLQEGDTVYGIGSPKGLVNTVTSGIFSGYRWLGDNSHYLQVDVPINPGNSGGPLINQYGQVLGVNTASYKDSEGLGFAIPIEAVYAEFSHLL